MPRSTFIAMKDEDRLGLGVQSDGAQWLAEARQMLDFNLTRLRTEHDPESSREFVSRQEP